MGERTLNVGLVGVSGALGTEVLALLREEKFPIDKVKLFGAGGSAGDIHELGGTHHVVRRFAHEAIDDLDVVILTTPPSVSRRLTAEILAKGVYVVDASSTSRDNPDIPVIVAPVNRGALEDATGVVATPGAFATAIAHILSNLPEGELPKRVEATGLASAAALGRKGMAALSSQVLAVLNGRTFDNEVYPRQLAFDLIPWVGDGSPDDTSPFSSEERRTTNDIAQLFPDLPTPLGITLAQAPVFCGHSLSLRLDFDTPHPLDAFVAAFEKTPALDLRAGTGPDGVPSALDAAVQPEVLVGRIRLDEDERTLRLWLTFDNLRLTARNILMTLEALRDEAVI